MLDLGLSLSAAAARGGVSYDPAAVTAFAAMTSQPDATRKGHYNTLIKALKTGGVWTKLDIFYVCAAHDAQAARLNLKAPSTFAATATNSPTFTTDRGYTGNGTTSIVNTTWNAGTHGVNYVLNSAHLSTWTLTAAQEAGSCIGARFSGGPYVANLINPRHTTDVVQYRINDATVSTAANTDGTGMYIAARPDANTKRAFRNGAQIGSDAAVASTAVPNQVLWFCGAENANFSTRQIAMASAGANLTSGEATAFYNAVRAYLQAVGAVA